MAYERVNWENLPSTKTPVNEDNLNKLNDAIDQNANNIGGQDYDATSTYDVRDIVKYQGQLYICTTAITTAEAWNSNHWQATDVLSSAGGNGTNIITAGLNSDYVTTSTNAEKLTLNKEITKIGANLSLSSGSVVIGSGINYIKISSQVNLANGMQSGDRIMALIQKNDDNISVTNMIVRGLFETMFFSPKLISVSEGDTISVYIRTLTRSGALIPSDSNFTYITVETVK